jgi:hypothetical protein
MPRSRDTGLVLEGAEEDHEEAEEEEVEDVDEARGTEGVCREEGLLEESASWQA